MLQKAFGAKCLLRLRVLEWHILFENGQESVEDNPRSGCPLTLTDDIYFRAVKDLVMAD